MVTPVARIIGFAGVLVVTVAMPMQFSDTAVVSSTLREVYVEPPGDMLVAASSHSSRHSEGGKDGKGREKKSYRRRHSTSGDDGYSHYDEFHTKHGDKYGFEKHSEYGKGKKGAAAGAFHDDQGGKSTNNKEIHLYDTGAYLVPRSRSLHDLEQDAFQLSDDRQRKALREDDGDLFFMFGGGDGYVAADGSEGSDEGDQGGDHEADDGERGDHDEGDDGEDDHQDDDSGQGQKKKKSDDDDSSEGADYDE